MPSHDDDPFTLRGSENVGGWTSSNKNVWYDCKVYPYTPPGIPPMFAAIGAHRTLIFRPVLEKENCIDIYRSFEDEDIDAGYNSLEWSQAANGDPLLCVSGENKTIKVLNVKTGQLVTTLVGHGDAIVDLAISPIDPNILASASNDHSVRLWTLDPVHQRQPTAAIAFGEGHIEDVLCLGWHRNGRYLLSGGQDTRLNLWMIPDNLKEKMGTDKPSAMHYPHFSSTEVHTDYIDCVRFYNDYIFSRCAKSNKILLWMIEDFDSSCEPPNPAPIPPSQAVQSSKPVRIPASQISGTRSAWGRRFQRLLQFDTPDSDIWYIRFGLFHEAGRHPVLAAGNMHNKICFWDLQKLEKVKTGENVPVKRKSGKGAAGPSTLKSNLVERVREESESAQSDSSALTSSTNHPAPGRPPKKARSIKIVGEGEEEEEEEEEREFDRTTGIGDPFRSIVPHKTIQLERKKSIGSQIVRQVAFSRGGEWCVACGDHGMIAVMNRWEDGFPPSAP